MHPLALAIVFPIACFFAFACVPSSIANAKAKIARQLTTFLAALQCFVALLLVCGLAAAVEIPQSISLLDRTWDLGFDIQIYFDGTTSLMLVLVSFVGFVVSRFSIRYLDGEALQGRYFRWLGFTIGAVSLMVVAGNLLLFFAAWVATSLGLHQLLLHYRHRPAAQRAAWTKFAISRLGDAFLVGALVLTFKTFGTFELAELFARARELADGSHATSSHAAIGWLLVLGAVTKSAQFPFHTWLPDTMETPTPVSALMHAGIVNAGGYLIIRMSPIVALAPAALMALAVVGAFTACLAGMVMMTQPSVKRALAYSTIAQMGFMMLQCGLGAFSAAMLHILAHSLYKAHAFLSSGTVLSRSFATTSARAPLPSLRLSISCLIGAAVTTALAYLAISTALGLGTTSKPGGLVLAFILWLALTTWSWRIFMVGERTTTLLGITGVSALCLTYTGSYLVVHHLIQPTAAVFTLSPTMQFMSVMIVLSFSALFVLHSLVLRQPRPRWLEPLRVHAANGFYIDAIYRRVVVSLADL